MTSSLVAEAVPSAPAVAGRDTRLTLKPATTTDTGHVDGAWWPRSRDLVAELPSLVQGLSAEIGHPDRVSYRLADWDPAPRRVGVGASLVHLAGYRSLSPDTVNVLVGRRWLVLLVVPPGTSEETAQRAIAGAGGSGNTDSVADLLAAHTPGRTAGLPNPTRSTDEDPS